MFILLSHKDYEGSTFHGVFSNKPKARKAIEYLRKLEYDCAEFEIKKVAVDTVTVNQCSDIFPDMHFA